MSYQFNWTAVLAHWPQLAKGLLFTLQIVLVSYLISLVVGLIVGMLRLSPSRLIRAIAFAYTQFFRAVSTYISIIWIYFGLAIAFGLNLSPFTAGVCSIVLLNSAYMSEIYRSAISSVDTGQREVAYSLGLGRTMTFFDIVFPQALRIAMPQLINQFTFAVKDSAIVALIGASDLMYETIRAANVEFLSFEFYTTAAAIYLAIVFFVSWLGYQAERRLSVGHA
jgi:His/Glu/Gln/Arg/opine family amino acid ABC transporter permease subunit